MKDSAGSITDHDYRSIGVRAEMACLENVTEVRRAGREDESMGRHVPSAGRGQQNIRERFRVKQRRDGAMQMRSVAVPLELIILRCGNGHLFCIGQKTSDYYYNVKFNDIALILHR